jgi:hypothetical protein
VAHVDSQYVVGLVLDSHRPFDDEMDVPITVTTHQFAVSVSKVPVTDELFVLPRNVGRTPDGVALSFVGVVDRDFHAPRRENGVFVMRHIEHVVSEDDGLFRPGPGFGVFLLLYLRRLLVGCRVQVGVSVSAVDRRLERLIFTGEQVRFPVGERVEWSGV